MPSWKLVYAAISPNANKKYKLLSLLFINFFVFLWLFLFADGDSPVLPSVFVCLRLFRRQFWKLNTISRKGFYALTKWVLTRRWKLNKLWLNKHAEPTMDSCDECFSWQRLSGFFLTCRNAASSNGKRAKYSLHSAMKNKHQEMAFKQSSAVSHWLILSKYWHCLHCHLLAEPVYFISCSHLMEMHLIYKFWCWSFFGVFSILGLQKNCNTE